jgi:signal transduction histidine kinase
MNSVRMRWVFWALAIIGVIVNLVHDLQIHLQNKVSDVTGLSVTHTYQVLNELDQLLIAYQKPESPEIFKAEINQRLKSLKELTRDNSIQQANLDLISQIKPTQSIQEIAPILRKVRHEEEKLLIDRVAMDEVADQKAKQQFFVANCIDAAMVFFLGVVFWMEIRVRRRMEKIMRETISQQHRANERLLLADQTKTHLLKTTVHDLKNPLGSILGFADLIREESKSETVMQLSKVIQNISEGTLSLVNSMLQPTSLGVGAMYVEFQKMNILDCLKEVLHLLEPLAKAKKQHLSFETHADSIFAEADYLKMRDVFSNIIGNAIKFSSIGGRILVRIQENAESVDIFVEDDGPGFSLRDKARAFQFSQTLSAKPTGGEVSTGLGLFSAKTTMDLHAGKIEIQDRKAGRGTCFFLQLPLQQKHKTT